MGLDKVAGEWGQGCRYVHPERSYQWLIVKTENSAGKPESAAWEDRLIELHLLAKREPWWDVSAFEHRKGCSRAHWYNLSSPLG